MKSGDTFELDSQSLDELAAFGKTTVSELNKKKINEGDTFSIAKAELCKGDIVRASKWEGGKPTRGRPRRFPRAIVLRLLNETETQEPTQTAEEAVESQEADEQVALEQRAEALLGAGVGASAFSDDDDDDDSW